MLSESRRHLILVLELGDETVGVCAVERPAARIVNSFSFGLPQGLSDARPDGWIRNDRRVRSVHSDQFFACGVKNDADARARRAFGSLKAVQFCSTRSCPSWGDRIALLPQWRLPELDRWDLASYMSAVLFTAFREASRMKRLYLFGSVIAVLVALLPTEALASTTTYTESVVGIETGTPTSCPGNNSLSSFAGVVFGTLNGTFQAAICHTPLNPGATILGGTFLMSDGTTTVTGTFASGTVIHLVDLFAGSLCVQKYSVSGALVTGFPPVGNFVAALTHYGFRDGAACHVFFATVAGRATLTGPLVSDSESAGPS